jgi:hypothetical protein
MLAYWVYRRRRLQKSRERVRRAHAQAGLATAGEAVVFPASQTNSKSKKQNKKEQNNPKDRGSKLFMDML